MKNKSSTDIPEYSKDAEVEIPKPEKAFDFTKKKLENETEENYKMRMQKMNIKFDSSVSDRLEEE
jgi:hypothetical protein